MRILILALIPLACAGCGRSPPTLAGGRPVAHWVTVLNQSADTRSRKDAAFKLGNVGPRDPEAYPALVKALKDPDAVVRREAIRALLKFSPVAQDAVPLLIELGERDGDDTVRASARKALEKIRGRT